VTANEKQNLEPLGSLGHPSSKVYICAELLPRALEKHRIEVRLK